MRCSELERNTRETKIDVKLNVDGAGKTGISTGIGFFDHMLTAFAFHAGLDMELCADGDLQVDMHHTVEDTGIVLGKALAAALAQEPNARYGDSLVPMDEALAQTVLDISGRPYLVYDSCGLEQRGIAGFDACLVEEFLRALAMNAGITLHCRVLYGSNGHHMAEALFKSLGRALKKAAEPRAELLSTKGRLG